MSEQQEVKLVDEDQVFAYTHSKRKEVVEDLTKAGIPTDPDNVKVLLTALKDMDGQALGRKRIKVEERANSNQADAAALIAKVLAASHGTSPAAIIEGVFHRVPTLPDDIPEPMLIEGEICTVIVQQNIDDFLAKLPQDFSAEE
ncbi:MAG: hypothetical protein ACD_84C00038G0008 [uncultured bacterium]|nr:MAG: hypothetical protein ACD_84C00038G0008 [uncultured bacterium]